ncbi:hypothetical protein ADM99_14185 [Leptolinea tardivitalis]|uniref:XRE family transcriptional regulator n=2 Tax=Leptolinea tardivitalis TaxID=229920 RepID=A0A0P6WNA1_9CHLR|nr:hypothetical protein ADM99_14185 [Leptolinea tardivitalis]GAP21865.1 hypothetical protein LTAR_02083 [Leptolinea tardivitalis]
MIMSNFPDWFTQEYRRWNKTRPGEEDFLAFCSLLGYTPETVLSWMHGESTPQNGEVLSIAGMFSVKVYKVLGLPEPDKEILQAYVSFSNLAGELRSKAAHALWEADVEIKNNRISPQSDEAKAIIAKTFDKWGFAVSGN